MSGLTIGEVAREAGVPIETVRYYERRGLIPPPPRTRAGYRKYPADATRRIQFIRRAQGLGFTLNEIARLLTLRQLAGRNCDAVEREARGVISRVESRITDLEQIKAGLHRLVTACRNRTALDECPILNALEQEDRVR